MLIILFPISIVLPFVPAALFSTRASLKWADNRPLRLLIGLVIFVSWLTCFLLFPCGATLVSGESLWGIDFSLQASPLEYIVLLFLALIFILSQFHPLKSEESKGSMWSLAFWGWGFTQLFVLSSALLPEIFFLLMWGLIPIIRLTLPGGDIGKEDGTRMTYFVSAVGISLLFAWITGFGKLGLPLLGSFAAPTSRATSAGLVFAGLALLTLLGGTPFSSYNYLLRQKVKPQERMAFSFQLIVLGGYLMIKLSSVLAYGGSFLPFLILGSIAILGGGFSALKEPVPERYRVQLSSLYFGLLLLFMGAGNPPSASLVVLGILVSLIMFAILELLWLWRMVLPGISRITCWALVIIICGLPPTSGYLLWNWGYSSLLLLPLWQKIVFIPIAVLGQGLLLSAILRIRPTKVKDQNPAGKSAVPASRLVIVPFAFGLAALAFGPLWSSLTGWCQSGKSPIGSISWSLGFSWSTFVGLLMLIGVGAAILLYSLSRKAPGKLSGGESLIFHLLPMSILYKASNSGWFDSYRYLYYGIRFMSFALIRVERAIDRMPSSITWLLTLPGRLLYDRLFRNVKGK